MGKAQIVIPPGPRLGDLVIEAENLKKGFGDKLLIEHLSFRLPPGGIVGVATVWALVDLPDRPYVVAVMSSYGGDGGAMLEAVSTVAWSYFSRLSGVTRYGTRVPLDVKRQLENRPR